MTEQQTKHICCYCDRAYDEPPERSLMVNTATNASRDMGVYERYNWACGECTEGGKHWLASRVHGIAHRKSVTSELDIITSSHTYTREDRNTKPHLAQRMQYWLDKVDDADHVTFYSLFDLLPPTQPHHEGWFFPFMDERGKPTEPVQPQHYFTDILRAQGAKKLMKWFAAHYTERWVKRSKYGSVSFYDKFRRPRGVDYRLAVFTWRSDDDGIGGWKSPLLFIIQKSDSEDMRPSSAGQMVVLCSQDVWMGHGDDTDIEESFDADKLFFSMYDRLEMRGEDRYEDYW